MPDALNQKRFVTLQPEMCTDNPYLIDLKALSDGITTADYTLDDAFFEAVGGQEVTKGTVHASLTIRKTGDLTEIEISMEGTVVVTCDRCLDDMECAVSSCDSLSARLATGRLDEATAPDDDTIIVDERRGTLDIAWYMYETIAVALPTKRVHEDGKCNPQMLEVIEKYRIQRE